MLAIIASQICHCLVVSCVCERVQYRPTTIFRKIASCAIEACYILETFIAKTFHWRCFGFGNFLKTITLVFSLLWNIFLNHASSVSNTKNGKWNVSTLSVVANTSHVDCHSCLKNTHDIVMKGLSFLKLHLLRSFSHFLCICNKLVKKWSDLRRRFNVRAFPSLIIISVKRRGSRTC